jgi:outer membrane receptor protein involved in Fe transport
LLLCGSFILPVVAAQADDQQTVAALDAFGGTGTETVVVTGSRIATQTAVANSPIASLTEKAIEDTGAITLEAALANLPQFSVGSGATSTGFTASGMASVNLRGLGYQRNLVLLDGRRLQPSNNQQVVDINTIPKAIIGGIEIITGGASAVYGSDAIAGVINFKTRKFQGVEINAEYSASEAYGGGTQDYSLTVGGNFAENRGNALISVAYTKRDPINFTDIAFYQQNTGGGDLRTGEGTYNPSSNRPSQAALNTLFATYGIAAGSVPTNSYLSFNADGTLFAATNGLANFKGNLALVGVGGAIKYKNISLLAQTPLERYTGFAKATYDISDAIHAFAQLSLTNYNSTTLAEAGNTTLTIPVTNPFIPSSLAALLASRANPTASLLLEKRFYEAGPRINNREFNVLQALAGLGGRIEAIDGDWEIYGSHGETKVTTISPGSVVSSKLKTLLNAADGGAGTCSGGYNPFNITKLSDACYTYLVASPLQRTSLTQDILEANLQGHAFSLPAGEVHFAVGASYRADGYTFKPDSDIAGGTTVGVPAAGASAGATNVYELYGELLVPVVKDLPFAKDVSLDLAYRYSNYNLSGGAHTYKADANWLVVDGVRLRGGYQRAVRAPNVGELFIAPSTSSAAIGELASGGGDPCAYNSTPRAGANAANIKTLCVALGVPSSLIDTFTNAQNDMPSTNTGNTALKPETADTLTFGTVLTSPFETEALAQAQLSVDYYNIALKDAIGSISGQTALNKCFNLDGSNPSYSASYNYCGLFTRNTSTGVMTAVLLPPWNLGAYRTSGIDVEASWKSGLGALGLSDEYGTVGLNVYGNYLLGYKIQAVSNGSWADFANATGYVPRLKTNTTLSYGIEDYGFGLRWRHLNHQKASAKVSNPASTTPDTGAFDAFDVFADWKITDQLKLSGGLTNLFDRDPPVVGGVAGSTDANTYDTLGRSFYISLMVAL